MNLFRTALVAALAAVAAGSATAQFSTQQIVVGTAKPQEKSGPVCGGIVNGKAQQPCARKPALYEGPALGECPKGTFFDIGLWQCWSCPAGYNRSAAAVDSDRACSKPDSSVKGEYKKAELRGGICPPGSFHDPIRGGECWSCPSGYKRSAAHIEAANACFIAAHEEFREINKHNKATGIFGTDCPRGQFWDGIDGFCYSCPGGFNRTGYSVRDSRACSRAVAEQQARATNRGKSGCEKGEFEDLTRAECWRCPKEFDRTVFPVTGNQACERGGGFRWAKAKKEKDLTCPAGQHFDFIAVTDQEIRDRQTAQNKDKIARVKAGAKSTKSGTCWSCPANYRRTEDSVKTDRACDAADIEWRTAEYREPGLFGLKGADEVLIEIVKNRGEFAKQTLEATVKAVAKAENKSDDAVRKGVYSDFVYKPQESPAAFSMVFVRLLAAVAEPKKASPAENTLVDSFNKYIIARRTYIAEDALAAYDAWNEANRYWKAKRQDKQQSMTVLFDYGTVPPDFTQVTQLGMIGWATAGLAVGMIPVVGEVLSTALGLAVAYEDFKGFGTTAKTLSRTAAEIALGKAAEAAVKKFIAASTKKAVEEATRSIAKWAATQTATRMTAAAASAGPGLILSVSMIIGSIAVDQVTEIETARPKLVTSVAHAKRAPDLKRMATDDDGMVELVGYWSYVTTGPTSPSPSFQRAHVELAGKIVAAAITASKSGPTTPSGGWERMPGVAKAIGVGANGSVWHIGTNSVSGGFGIYRWDNNRWTSVPGGAVRIAVDPKGNPWVVNDKSEIFRHNGLSWQKMPGAANDIGVGANGRVWVLGTNKVPGGFGVHRWDNGKWTSIPGGGVRIAVDPQGNPWLANDQKKIFRYDGRRWINVPGMALDVGIGANGIVWHVGTNKVTGGFGVYAWNGKGWTSVSGGLTQIAVAPDGRPFGVNESGQIFWMK